VKVYQTSRQSRIHFDPDCRYLFMGNRRKNPVQSLDLTEIPHTKRFCVECSPPDLPQLPKIRHRPCHICYPGTRKAKPCAHNGGVLVFVQSHQTNRARVYVARTYRKWRWPENAGGSPLVPGQLAS
jgi:hypothetical protein